MLTLVRLDSVYYFDVNCAARFTMAHQRAYSSAPKSTRPHRQHSIGNTRHGKDPSIGLARHIDVPSRGNGTSSQFARVPCVQLALALRMR